VMVREKILNSYGDSLKFPAFSFNVLCLSEVQVL
jgi:hypothetical protein